MYSKACLYHLSGWHQRSGRPGLSWKSWMGCKDGIAGIATLPIHDILEPPNVICVCQIDSCFRENILGCRIWFIAAGSIKRSGLRSELFNGTCQHPVYTPPNSPLRHLVGIHVYASIIHPIVKYSCNSLDASSAEFMIDLPSSRTL